MPLVLLSGFVVGRDQVSIKDQSSTHCQLCCLGADSTSGHEDNSPVTTANEAYGMHSSLPVLVNLSSAAPVYESIDTDA